MYGWNFWKAKSEDKKLTLVEYLRKQEEREEKIRMMRLKFRNNKNVIKK